MLLRTFDIGSRPQLALDHDLWESVGGATERLYQVAKHPVPVLAPEAPWEGPGRGALWGPLHAERHAETGRVRLWYQSFDLYPGRGSNMGTRCLSIAESDDGVHFERPALGLTEWEGSTNNNMYAMRRGPYAPLVAAHSHGTIDSLAIDPAEDPAYRYKAVTWMGRDGMRYGRHGVAFSPDGLRWREYEGNPVSRFKDAGDVASGASLRDWFDPQNSGPYPASKYALFPKMLVRRGRWSRRSFAVMFSDDSAPIPFTQFDDPKLSLTTDERDDDMAEERLAGARDILLYDEPEDHRCEFYGVQVFRRGDVLLGLLWVYDASYEMSRMGTGNQYAIVEVQLVASRDGIHWRRVGNRRPVIPRGAPDAFDSHMIFYHALPIAVGDEWWIYYVGFNEGHTARSCYTDALRETYWADVARGTRHLPSIGLGKVRQEGFASLAAGTEGATLVTRPLRMTGGELRLNAAVRPGGEIRVEVRDEAGNAIDGFGAPDCAAIRADGVRLPVRWGDRLGDPAWSRRDVRLAFSLQDAELFAFQCKAA
ncbi:MAG TPA: hypothetical protein VML75_20715 [Kofleriaceae bacterium]|nr:hypothetical protein [Kofleriaceae bacterium]